MKHSYHVGFVQMHVLIYTFKVKSLLPLPYGQYLTLKCGKLYFGNLVSQLDMKIFTRMMEFFKCILCATLTFYYFPFFLF